MPAAMRNAKRRQASEDDERYQNQIEDFAIHNPDTEKQRGDHGADRKDDEPRRERKQQCFHGTPPADSAVLFFLSGA